MFDGDNDDDDHQFRESIHGGNSNCVPFDPYNQLEFLSNKSSGKQQVFLSNLAATTRMLPPPSSSSTWSSDDVLALLNLRSTVPISFPDFGWEHISRKLGEMGFRRTADECKKKFAEESNNTRIYNSQIDEFVYPHNNGGDPNASIRRRKRKEEKLEMVRGFVQEIVDKMMAKQEEMCKNLIEGIIRRDQEKIAREEAWKKEDMDRVAAEMELRVKEHEIAAQRQAAMIGFLKSFTTSDQIAENPNPNPIRIPIPIPNNDSPNQNPQNSTTSDHTSNPSCEGITMRACKRWPREEILALINLRCKMNNNGGGGGGGGGEEGGGMKGRVWERISDGMGEMGYKRSGKRCKEKWENINKYFRKTKDRKKKRSGESRTCPYFQELSCLYSDGTLHLAPSAK